MFWAVFILGWVLHLLLQIQVSVRSSSNGLDTGFCGILKWLQLSWVVVAVRLFFSIIAFSLWRASPSSFANFVSTSTGPLTWATVGVFGFAVDSFVDKVATLLGLKIEIPQLVPPKPDIPAAAAAEKSSQS